MRLLTKKAAIFTRGRKKEFDLKRRWRYERELKRVRKFRRRRED